MPRPRPAPTTRRAALTAAVACALAAGPGAAQPVAVVDDGAPVGGSAPLAPPEAPEPVSAPEPPSAPEPDPPPTTAMTDEQRSLYARGEAAARAGDWAAAARYFRAAVSLGGFNLGFLSLGEALARQGRCAEAATVLDGVPGSPAVPEAPARFADAMANAQRQALGRTCPGKLVVDCAAPMTRYRIVGGEEHTCGAPLELPAGRYRLRAGPDAMAVTVDAWVVGVETTRITLRLPRPLPAEAILGPVAEPARPRSDGWSTAGVAVMGLGGAVLVAGMATHGVTIDAWLDAEDAADRRAAGTIDEGDALEAYARHESLRQTTIALYAIGGVVALSGLAIVLIDPGGDPEKQPGSSLSLGPGWVGGRF